MRCPFCNFKETKVVDSRETHEGRAVRRRRLCQKCKARFSTYEEMELGRIFVVKRDGRKEEYSREKLTLGLERSLKKRPDEADKLGRALSEIEAALYLRGESQVLSRDIGKLVMDTLREIDQVAYIRFASVYKSFGSAKSFRREIEKLGD